VNGWLVGRRALVTGAGQGIGRAIAQRFAAEGARVALVDIDEEAVAGTAAAIGDAALAHVADVRDEDAVARAYEVATERFGGVDTVVANAAIEPADDAPLDRLELEVWERISAVNLTGLVLTAKHGVRALRAAGGGALVVTASPTGILGVAPEQAGYSISKSGAIGVTRVVAAGYATDGIRANAIVPGVIDTRANAAALADAQLRAQALAGVALARPGAPEEVAAVAAFLASDHAAYVTGAVWPVDGGLTSV
jgi:3-oxoacyl-[acyl-carrier protein] reductase